MNGDKDYKRQKTTRKINKNHKCYFVVDANMLADKHIPLQQITDKQQADLIRNSQHWWKEIDELIAENKSRVYIPDVCIAEAFKVIAKHYYVGLYNHATYDKVKKKLRNDISMSSKELSKKNRQVKYHDLATTRDIIISMDRFYEIFNKKKLYCVSTIDLILLGSAKYLMDFFDIPKKQLYILTSDEALIEGCSYTKEIPKPHNPRKNYPKRFFIRK